MHRKRSNKNKFILNTILFFFVSTRLCVAEVDFADTYLSREVNQSPFGTKESASEYNFNLYNTSRFRSSVDMGTLISASGIASKKALDFIEEKCYPNGQLDPKCKEHYQGDPIGFIAFTQVLEVDDSIGSNAIIEGNTKDRIELLEKAYKKYKDRDYDKTSPDSAYNKIRQRIKILVGEEGDAYLADLDKIALPDEEKYFEPIREYEKEIYNELLKIKGYTEKSYFPDLLKEPTEDIIKVLENIDGKLKSFVKGVSDSSHKYFKTANTVTKVAIDAAKFFGVPDKIQTELIKLHDMASTGLKIFNALGALGSAGMGNITAWVGAFKAISSLFAKSDSGPSFQEQVMNALNQVLKNQRIIIKRLDYIISQLDAISNMINQLHEDVVIIDQNIRLLIDFEQESIDRGFNFCFDRAQQIRKDTLMGDLSFNHLVYPYDKDVYKKIIKTAQNYRTEEDPFQHCPKDIRSLFFNIGEGLGPSNTFKLETTHDKLEQYFQSLLVFINDFKKKKYPDDNLSTVDTFNLLVMASVPASSLPGVDMKFKTDSTESKKNYIFGADSKEDVIQALSPPLDSFKIGLTLNRLYDTLPYIWLKPNIWIKLTKHSDSDSEKRVEGLDKFPKPAFISSTIDSLHLNLLASTQESLLQGDVLLPYLFRVLHRVEPVNGDKMQEKLYGDAINIISKNTVLRENYLRYLVYQGYKNDSRGAYRIHYNMCLLPSFMKRKLGDHLSFGKDKDGKILVDFLRSVDKEEPGKKIFTDENGRKYSRCSYKLPSPDIYSSYLFKHSAATKTLAVSRIRGNMLLSVIEAYHPDNQSIKRSGL